MSMRRLACVAGALSFFFPPGHRAKEIVSPRERAKHYNRRGQVTFVAGRLSVKSDLSACCTCYAQTCADLHRLWANANCYAGRWNFL